MLPGRPGHRLDDVAAPAHAAVADDLGAVRRRRRQRARPGRWRGAGRAGGHRGSTGRWRRRPVGGDAGVGDGWMPLMTRGPSRRSASSRGRPGQPGIELGVDVVRQGDGRALSRPHALGHVGEADRLAAHEGPRPAGVEGAVDDRAWPDRGWQGEPAAGHRFLVPTEHGSVDGQDECLVTTPAAGRPNQGRTKVDGHVKARRAHHGHMSVRREQVGDERAVHAVHAAAFRGDGEIPGEAIEAGLADELRSTGVAIPPLCLVAVVDRVVVGPHLRGTFRYAAPFDGL